MQHKNTALIVWIKNIPNHLNSKQYFVVKSKYWAAWIQISFGTVSNNPAIKWKVVPFIDLCFTCTGWESEVLSIINQLQFRWIKRKAKKSRNDLFWKLWCFCHIGTKSFYCLHAQHFGDVGCSDCWRTVWMPHSCLEHNRQTLINPKVIFFFESVTPARWCTGLTWLCCFAAAGHGLSWHWTVGMEWEGKIRIINNNNSTGK